MIHYPSLSAVQLKETLSLEWVVPSSLINDLKQYPKKVAYYGPISDNLCIACFPNGGLYEYQTQNINTDLFEFGVCSCARSA